MTPKEIFTTEKTKPGREDYNRQIFLINVPTVRKHQVRSVGRNFYEQLIPAGESVLLLHKPSVSNVQVNIFDIKVEINPIRLFKAYFGWVDIYALISTPMTEQDLIDTTTLGPFCKSYIYGLYDVSLKSPITYIPNEREYIYIYLESHAETDITYNVVVEAIHYFRDEYYSRWLYEIITFGRKD